MLPVSSAQALPFHFTIKPTFGAAGRFEDIAGEGGGGPPLAVTCAAGILWGADPPADPQTQPHALPDAVLQRTRPIFDGKSLDG